MSSFPQHLEPAPAPVETTNWAAVVEAGGCPQCGFPPGGIASAQVSSGVLASIGPWSTALQHHDSGTRPGRTTWSTVEYACHVRDLCRLVTARVSILLTFDDPVFDDWDQDRAAVAGAYWAEQPARVAPDLQGWSRAAAAVFAAVPDDQLERVGRRSDGHRFTVATLGANFLHEVRHHLWDVAGLNVDE